MCRETPASQDSSVFETASIGTTSLPLPPFAVAASPPSQSQGAHFDGLADSGTACAALRAGSERSATLELMDKGASAGLLPFQDAGPRGASEMAALAASQPGVAWFSPLGHPSGPLSGEHVRLSSCSTACIRLPAY